MTNEKRKYYDGIYLWARLKMSEDEYNDWIYTVSWPCSAEKPDGIFDDNSGLCYNIYF